MKNKVYNRTPNQRKKETVMVKEYRYTVVYIDGVPFYQIETLRTRKK